MRRFSFLTLALLALFVSCSKDNDQKGRKPVSWYERTDGFHDRYALEEMVVLSRHNIRSPLSGGGSVLSRITPHRWFEWTSAPSELSVKGGEAEVRMGSFFREWLKSEDLPADYLSMRFYANSLQRTIATAGYFAEGFLPAVSVDVETNAPYGTMDPVFNPQTTSVDDAFRSTALSEIAEMGGADGMKGLGAKVAAQLKLLENVLDMKDSPAAKNDTTSFALDDVTVTIEEGKEPSMKGGLKMACSAADALVLQYYEQQDDNLAGFGHTLAFSDWENIAKVKDWYQEILFTAPSVAGNVAKPLLKEILKELQVKDRTFCFLCGHDSNLGSVLSALGCEGYNAADAIEKDTPVGGKLVFQKWMGKDGVEYADAMLVYASANQLRFNKNLSLGNPPSAIPVHFKGLNANADGLYTLADLLSIFEKAVL